MTNQEEATYNEFLEKVKRTVYIDELTPLSTKTVLLSAFNQFGSVEDVVFIPNYLGPKELPVSALVIMETQENAKAVLDTLSQFPFMVAGMPRPVRAIVAEVEMFEDRPKEPGKKVYCRWIDPNETTEFVKAKKIKRLVQKHVAEAEFVLKDQLDEAEKLDKKQVETASGHHKKYEMMNQLLNEGSAERLAEHYNVKMRGNPYRFESERRVLLSDDDVGFTIV